MNLLDGYGFGKIFEGWDGKSYELQQDYLKVDKISDYLKGITL